jgi:hypothetical protein
MRHTDFAATLAVLFATTAQAVPARNAAFNAIQVGQQLPNGSSSAGLQQGVTGNQQQGIVNSVGQNQPESKPEAGAVAGGGTSPKSAPGAPAGLAVLPSAQVTAGQLQPLPGAATQAAVQSSIAAVETAPVLGQVSSEVKNDSLYLTKLCWSGLLTSLD